MKKRQNSFGAFLISTIIIALLSLSGAYADGTSQLTLLSSVPDKAPLMSIKPGKNTETASFCGACSNSDHSACGGQSNGWSCCSAGCSDSKMQCWNVVSCDKVSGIIYKPLERLVLRDTIPEE